MNTSQNTLHVDDLIEQADEGFGDWRSTRCSNPESPTTIETCEEFYMNGCADASAGDVESPTGHFYRVHRWIVTTDSQGFNELEEYDTETEAVVAFEQRADEYTQWAGDDDNAS